MNKSKKVQNLHQTFVKSLLIVLGTLSFSAQAAEITPMPDEVAELEWKLERDRDGITVYTAPVEGSKNKAVRAEMTVDNTISELAALVLDTDACPKWAALCKESYVAKSISPEEFYVYTYNDLPWPVTDREAVAHVLWTVDADSGLTEMRATIATGIVEKSKRTIQLSEGTTRWTFVPTEDGKTRLKEVGPSTPVRVVGFEGIPSAGDILVIANDEQTARDLAESRQR